MRRDRFGLRMREPHPATLVADLARSLRLRAEGPDTVAARVEVSAALVSKWWDMRLLAMRAIGRWLTEADRAWLVERARRPMPEAGAVREAPAGDALRWRAMEIAEARRVLFRRAPRPEDAEWLLELWFEEPGSRIWPSWLCGVPEATLRARVAAEIRGGDPRRLRRAIRLLFWTDRIDNRVDILRLLAAGTRAEAAELAREALVRLAPRIPPRAESAAARPLIPSHGKADAFPSRHAARAAARIRACQQS